MSTDPAAQTAAIAQADTPPPPAPILASISVRRASNGYIIGASYQNRLTPMIPPPTEYIFQTLAAVLTWLNTQGWTE